MQENNYHIKNWAIDDRPREKLLSRGAASLSNSELLAILIRMGTPNKSAVDLAKDILKLGKDNLNELGKLAVKDFMKIRGMGMAKSITIAAALELGRRRQAGTYIEKPFMFSSRDMANYINPRLQDYNHEVFAV